MKINNIADLDNPKANNESNTLDLFYWRSIYKEYSPTNTNSIDMWYEDMSYGKVDHNNIPIYLQDENLKQIRSSKTVFVANFVADAWESLRDHINSSVMGNEMSKDSLYSNMDPTAGWNNIELSYNDWAFEVHQMLLDYIDPVREKTITNFKDFVNIYLEFVDETKGSLPQTKESFILSSIISPMTSGLIIEIANAAHDHDGVKTKFLQDNNYYKIIKLAKRYGFKLDKNAPWRFIADLDSEKMQNYMKEYNINNKEEMYETLYSKSYSDAIEVFKYYLVEWYLSYYLENPHINEVVIKSCDNSSMPTVQNKELMTHALANQKFSQEFWIRLYAYIRAKESGKPWKQPKFDRVVDKTISILKLKNEDAAMRYLCKEMIKDEKKNHFLKNDYTEEQINVILKERSFNKGKGTFKF